jgi:hypothetical protein
MIKIDNCLTRQRQRGIGSRRGATKFELRSSAPKNNNPALAGDYLTTDAGKPGE